MEQFLVESLGGYVGPIRPANGTAFHRCPGEEGSVLEWLENGTSRDIVRKIDLSLDAFAQLTIFILQPWLNI